MQTRKVNWSGMFVPKALERQWIAKTIVEEYPCMAGKKLVDSDTEWVSKV